MSFLPAFRVRVAPGAARLRQPAKHAWNERHESLSAAYAHHFRFPRSVSSTAGLAGSQEQRAQAEACSGSSHGRGISSARGRRGRERVARSERPKAPKLYVVPFQLTQEEALKSLSAHEQGRWMAPLSSEQGATSTALVAWRPDCGMRAVFLPFRLVDAVASAMYSGQVGYTRTFTVTSSNGKPTTQTRTVYHWVRGSLRGIHFNGSGGDATTQIYADFLYPEDLLDAVKGSAAKDSKPFSAAALNIEEKPTLDPFRMTPESTTAEAMARMEAALVGMAESEMRQTHPGCSHVQWTTVSGVQVSEYSVRSVYLPAYVLVTPYRERRLKQFVGGATGQVSGEQTYSQVKAAVLGLGAGLAGSLAAAHLAEVAVLAGPAAFTVAAVASVAGLAIARWLPVWRNWRFQQAVDDRASQHTAGAGSDVSWEQATVAKHTHKDLGSSRERQAIYRERESSMTQGMDGRFEERRSLVVEDPRAAPALEVLGLELGCSFGRVQETFRRQAMCLHPDHNQDASPEAREVMAQKLRAVLAAYREICGSYLRVERNIQLCRDSAFAWRCSCWCSLARPVGYTETFASVWASSRLFSIRGQIQACSFRWRSVEHRKHSAFQRVGARRLLFQCRFCGDF